jgi:YegS/Rv2252/BmrU family lipid kinase
VKLPRTAAIVNPRAATGRTGRRWPELAASLPELDVRFTSAPGHATELTRECLRGGYERIVAVGGDGTINEVVNGFLIDGRPIAPEATLSILPIGTGSDFQKSLGIGSLDDAIKLIGQERPGAIDIGKVEYRSPGGGLESRYFANVVSFGMGGEVAARAKNVVSKVSGKGAFLLATAQVFLTYSPKTAALTVDGEERGPYTITNIAIGNGRYHGGGMHVCPRALLDDGELDVTVIEALSSYELARDIKLLYSENLYVHPKTYHLRGRRISARSGQLVSIEVDGEALGFLPLEFSVVPQAIRVARRVGQ